DRCPVRKMNGIAPILLLRLFTRFCQPYTPAPGRRRKGQNFPCRRLFYLTPQTADSPDQQQKQSAGHQRIHNKLEHIESACPAKMKMTEHPAHPFVQLRKQRLSHARSVDFSEL